MASKEEKLDIRRAKAAAKPFRKAQPFLQGLTTKEVNKARRADAKNSGFQQPKVTNTSDGKKMTSKSISATKPSMPVKTGVKNKLKAQGSKAMSAPTDRYGRSTKPKK